MYLDSTSASVESEVFRNENADNLDTTAIQIFSQIIILQLPNC